MANYIMLFQFTDQGIRNVRDTTKRAAAAGQLARKMGVKIKDFFWTLGRFDGVLVIEAPNDEAATAFSLKVSSVGNVKSQTLRAFRSKEMDAILRKIR